MQRLRTLQEKTKSDFEEDPYLRDIAERNLEVVAQCCIDICGRVISIEDGPKPQDYYEAIRLQGEMGIVPSDLAKRLAPLAGFRNVLAHRYLDVNWDEVYEHLHQLDDLAEYAEHVRRWLQNQK